MIGKTISVKVIFIILLALLLVTGGTGAVSFFSQRKALYESFTDRNERLLERLSFTIREPLWFLDTGSIELLVAFEMEENNALSITIMSDDGETVILAKTKANGAIVDLDPEAAALMGKHGGKAGGEAARGEPAANTDPAGERDPSLPAGVYTRLRKDILKDDGIIGHLVLDTTDGPIIEELRLLLLRTAIQFAFLTIVLVLVIFIGMKRMVISPVRSVYRFIGRLSEGDLTETLGITSDDEMGELSSRMNSFIGSLNEMLANLKEISTGSAAVGEEIAVSMEEISSTMEETDSMMHQIASKTEILANDIGISTSAVDGIKEDLRKLSVKIDGQRSAVTATVLRVRRMIGSVDEVAGITGARLADLRKLSSRAEEGGREMRRTREAIRSITRSADLIRGVLGVIEDVADKSNLLAMNAAIEAAHAGAAGKGFAVVAGEIRRLSVTTAENARKVSGTVDEIITGIRDTERVTLSAESVIGDILTEVDTLAKSIGTILDTIQEVSRDGSGIDGALSEMTSLGDEVKASADSIDRESNRIREAMGKVTGLAAESLRSIGEIADGIDSVSSSMEVLAATGVKNSDTTRIIESELRRFKTAKE